MGIEVNRYCFNYKRQILFIVAIILSSSVGAKSPDLIKLRSELALFACMKMNYQSMGIDTFKNDFSYFDNRYSQVAGRSNVDYDVKFGEFLTKYAGSFYKEEISVKAENSRGPHTVILAKCAEFSDSQMLRTFFLKNPLPAKRSKD